MKKYFYKNFYGNIFLLLIFLCSGVSTQVRVKSFKLGVENISVSWLKKFCSNKKNEKCVIGLITNQTGVNQKGERTIDILMQRDDCRLKYIFTPEHGFNGISAERDVPDSVDATTSIPIISLYGHGSGKMIAAEYIHNVDCFIFDIQDSGMRHYTYISTLLNAMKIIGEHNKPFIVLDRPNPLATVMEGPLVDPSLISFISIASIPLRHGMTIGELARYFNKHVLEKPINLQVIKMKNYDRTQGFMGNFLHQLSPNLQSLQSCYGYSFLGLLGEVEPFDVGVGTPQAFQCIMLPQAKNISADVWTRLQELLDSFGIKSYFYHHKNKKNKKNSKGLRLEFTRIDKIHSFDVLVAVLQFFKKEEIPFSFSAAFNKAVGTKKVQEVLAGIIPQELFFKEISHDLEQFYKKARSSFLYSPRPLFVLK